MVSNLKFFTITCSLVLLGPIIEQSAICGEANLLSRKALLSYKYVEHGIALSITNVGTEPFVVDDQLIIGIRWLFYDEYMNPLQLEAAISPILPEIEAENRNRLLLLHPGKNIVRQVHFNRPIKYFAGAMGYQADDTPLVSAAEKEFNVPKATRYIRVGYWLLYPVDLAALSYLAEHDERDKLFTDCTPSLLIDLDEVISFTHGLCRKYIFGHRPILPAAVIENLSENEGKLPDD